MVQASNRNVSVIFHLGLDWRPGERKYDIRSENYDGNDARMVKKGTTRVPVASKVDESSENDEETKVQSHKNGTMPSTVATKDDGSSTNEEEKKVNAKVVNELSNKSVMPDPVTMPSPGSTEDYDSSESHEETKGRVDGTTGKQMWTTRPTKTTRGDFIFKMDIQIIEKYISIMTLSLYMKKYDVIS